MACEAMFKNAMIDYLAAKFEHGTTYSEKEVDAILKSWHTFNDWPLIRRTWLSMGCSREIQMDRVSISEELLMCGRKPAAAGFLYPISHECAGTIASRHTQ